MLLLLFGSGQGVFIWLGPVSRRTVVVEPESRHINIT